MTENAALCEVLVVEDDREVREELAHTIAGAEDFSVTAALGSSREVFAALDRGLVFEAALIDLGLPDGSGLALLPALRRARPSASLLVLTIFDDERSVVGAIRAGADGYLLKDARPEEIVSSLRQVRSGAAPVASRAARHLLPIVQRGAGASSREPGAPTLTPRELEVLSLLARGCSYAETAAALGVQIGTIQTHVKSIYERLGVSSKAEATGLALRLGLID